MRPSRIGGRLDIYRVTRLPRRWSMAFPNPLLPALYRLAGGSYDPAAGLVRAEDFPPRQVMDVSHWMNDG